MTNHGKTYTKVVEKLEFEPMIDASNIAISIQGDDDIVVLSGTVKSFAEKFAAEKAVKSLTNVRTIANEIEVNFSTNYHKTDVEIAKEVTNALKNNVFIASKNIQSVIKHGIVTLTGNVAWHYQKKEAFDSINRLFGIKSITNNIKIKPLITIDSSKVKSQITKEFERHARIDAEKIEIIVEGNNITLTGKVRNFDEIDEAEHAAWAVTGVENVNNKLTLIGNW